MKSICFCLTLALIVLSTGCLAQTSEKRILRNQVRAPLVALKTMPYQDLAVDLTRAVDENLADVYATPIVVDLVSTDLPTGSDKASVKIKLSAPAPNTIVAIIRCDNAKGRSLVEPQVQAIIFRPGDPLVSSVDCKVKRALAGDSVRFTQVHVPDGGKPGARKAVATFTSASAIDGMPKASARLPFAFRPLGDLVYQLDPASVKISDENAKGQWSTALSHGRTQPANNETGYYGTVAMGAVKRTDKTINLQTGRNATV